VRRRHFITLIGGAATWPLVARAQQPVIPVVGFLNAASPEGYARFVTAFRQGLKEVGYAEGDNVSIEYRWAENRLDRLPELAADLVGRRVAVIVATAGAAPAIAAKAATTTIPIVFTVPEDPVRLGLVASLSRPGANVTGVNVFTGELMPKRLELMREMVPAMTRVAVFVNPADPARAEFQRGEAESAGRAMGLTTQIVNAGTSRDINTVFATFARERPDALFISPHPFYNVQRVQIAMLAARHAIPTSFSTLVPVEAGGLMSYGSTLDGYREAGVYTGRILKGTNPADLPVVQVSSFELVINAQTALMLGLTIPDKLLATADEVIE